MVWHIATAAAVGQELLPHMATTDLSGNACNLPAHRSESDAEMLPDDRKLAQ